MADVKWIKITTDVFDDEKILLIETLPEADSIIVIWFKLLCMAGKQNNSGVFMMNNQIAYTDKMLATIFRRKEATVQLALQTFEQFGMIEIVDGVITIPNWGKHQSLDQLESKKEYMRNYMQGYREKQKALTGKTNSKTNSKTNVSQADKEEELRSKIKELEENKKENVKKKKADAFGDIINSYTDYAPLQNAINEFIKMRTKIKAPLTDNALELMLKKLDKLATNDDTKILILNQSIMNCWKGVFELKEERGKQNGTTEKFDADTKFDRFFSEENYI